MTDLEKARKVLEQENASLVILKNNTIKTYFNNGIKDLLLILKEDKKALQNSIIADKIIGKVACSIMIKAGVKEIFAKTISNLALEIMEKYNIKFEYENKIQYIQNREKTDMCPMEERFKDETNLDVIWNEYI